MTWNINRGIGSNSPNDWEQPHIANIVNYLKPDVWNINELGGEKSGFNASAEKAALTTFVSQKVTAFGANPVEGKDYFVYLGSATDGYTCNAIVSRYALTDQTTYADGLRGLVHANVNLPGGGVLGDFTEHLKATTSSANSTQESIVRQFEAETSAGNLSDWFQSNRNTPAVLTGDFNLSEDPGEDDNWTGGNVGDVLPNGHIFHPITTLEGSGFVDSKPVSVNGDPDTIRSGSSNPTTRFDYNLYSATGGIKYVSGQVMNTAAYPFDQYPGNLAYEDSGSASDHLPVFATYNISTPVPEPSMLGGLSFAMVGVLIRRKKGKKKDGK